MLQNLNFAVCKIVITFANAKFTNAYSMAEIEESPIIQRLKQFIASTGLSTTQFADKAMIPRPSLSQLLHGRNKSINNQILAKLDESFPELDIVWLLFGRGDMQSAANFETSEAQNRPETASQVNETPKTQTANDEPFFYYGNPPKSPKSKISPSGLSEEDNGAALSAEELCRSLPLRAGNRESAGNRRITSIIVLYSDNSFETFNPAE